MSADERTGDRLACLYRCHTIAIILSLATITSHSQKSTDPRTHVHYLLQGREAIVIDVAGVRELNRRDHLRWEAADGRHPVSRFRRLLRRATAPTRNCHGTLACPSSSAPICPAVEPNTARGFFTAVCSRRRSFGDDTRHSSGMLSA